ncbi:MAG: hypothetical protein NXI00_19125 [Cytophagales bacterium]|nr:hypothetical protein [Cytophagales bacterium]
MKAYSQYGVFGGVTDQYKKPVPKAEKASPAAKAEIREVGGPQVIAELSTVAKFKNNSITQVNVYKSVNPRLQNPNKMDNLLSQNGNDNQYNGYMSPATRRHVEQMISVWLTSIELNEDLPKKEKKVSAREVFPTFITLTLPCSQFHSDNTIKKKVLAPFIDWLTAESGEVYKRGPRKGELKSFGVKGLFWRAEPQKNTRIHFHLIVDRYVPWERIREKWIACTEKLGYVTMYSRSRKRIFKDGFKIDAEKVESDRKTLISYMEEVQRTRHLKYDVHPVFERYLRNVAKTGKALTPAIIDQVVEEKQRAAYESELACDFMNPFCTHIRAIKDLDSVTAYVVKYIAKKPTEKPLLPGQEIHYNETWGREMLHTYEEQIDEFTGEVVKVEVDIQEVHREFEERKINGRIWGCTDFLRGFKPKEDDNVEVDEVGRSYLIETVKYDQDGKPSEITRKPVPVLKFFSKTIAEGFRIMNRDGNSLSFYDSDMEVVSPIAKKYVDDMIEVVGQNTVEAISAKVGESFSRMQGKIVPFRPEKMGFKSKDPNKPPVVKHAEIMKLKAPELYKEYVAYYKHIYDCFYSELKAA